MDIYNKGVDKKAFGKRLRLIRKNKDISSERLSEMTDKSSGSAVRHIEAGSTSPSLDNLVNICNALDISPEYLLSDSLQLSERPKLDEELRSLTPQSIAIVKAVIDTLKKVELEQLEEMNTEEQDD